MHDDHQHEAGAMESSPGSSPEPARACADGCCGHEAHADAPAMGPAGARAQGAPSPATPAPENAAGAACDTEACGCKSTTIVFDGAHSGFRRVLKIVIAINALMFVVEMLAGALARSRALQADALDFLGDTLTYGLSLAVIGKPLKTRARAAVLKGLSLLFMGLWVLGATIWSIFVLGRPVAPVMGGIALLALAANLVSVWLLLPWKDGDANVRSVWLCSRNDAIGNVGVMIAAALVWLTGSPWPDLAFALVMAGLFTSSAVRILRQAGAELKHASA